ncbi:hypothetical protein C1H46_016580 [Malus baccata]|uniref:Uncharacterized protein n=1 Tax=Malus baccata TaxID=106549 RepID=A0A540MGB6_MALBA|nr:hypothetical protein C1H46_016580 [Malus baccata]
MATPVFSKSLIPLPQFKWTKKDETTSQNDNPCQQLSSNQKLVELHLEAEKSGAKSSNVENGANSVPSIEVNADARRSRSRNRLQIRKNEALHLFKIEEKVAVIVEKEPKPEVHKVLYLASLAAKAATEELEEGNAASAGPSKAEGKEKSAQMKDNKPKISIEVMKNGIEDDLFIMTWQRPSRSPKKRNKNMQYQLDYSN